MIDQAGLLSTAEEQALVGRLASFETETRHQIAILTIVSLEGEAIESYALRAAETWKLGDAEFDNGVIVVVAAKDRRARIEVGYGLEGAIPDALAARIIRDYMIPEFKQGAMGRGLTRGADAIMQAARGEILPAAPQRSRGPSNDPAGTFFMSLVAGVMLGGFAGHKRSWIGPIVAGATAGGLGFILSASIAMALVVAVFAASSSAAFYAGGLTSSTGTRPYGRRYPRTGGYGGGGFGGGGLGGGGFGGGGFSGGGGGFGGGGASGGW